MQESRSSGSVEGVVSNHDPYSDVGWFGFCFSEATHTAAHKKQMPFVAGRGAWPSALSRAPGFGVHWSEAKTLDGRSGRIRRRFSAGRAEGEKIFRMKLFVGGRKTVSAKC